MSLIAANVKYSRPYFEPVNLNSLSIAVEMSLTDEIYAILFVAALAVSFLTLVVLRLVSKTPLFPKDVIKIPRFRHVEYDALPSFAENGNIDGQKEAKSFALEPLKGWRFRLGILQKLVLISLVIVHTLILVLNGATGLRIIYVPYWVLTIASRNQW